MEIKTKFDVGDNVIIKYSGEKEQVDAIEWDGKRIRYRTYTNRVLLYYDEDEIELDPSK